MQPTEELSDAEFDRLHGGRELLPIEQLAYEAEGAERFHRFHGHGRSWPAQAENFMSYRPRKALDQDGGKNEEPTHA